MQDYKSFKFIALGCEWNILLPKSFSDKAQKKVEIIAIEFEERFSRFNKNSFLRKLSGKSGEVKVGKDFVKMLKIYKKFNAISKSFSPLVANVLVDLGYDQDYSLKPKAKISKILSFKKNVKIIDEESIFLKDKLDFDFGALGKGFLVDKIKDFLISNCCKSFLINASGDCFAFGDRIFRCGLEDPTNSQRIVGVCELQNGSLCASSKNRRSWGEYSHIIDPYDLKGKRDLNILSTWVIAKEAALADALATSLFVIDQSLLKEKFDFEFLILFKNNQVLRSEKLKLLPQT